MTSSSAPPQPFTLKSSRWPLAVVAAALSAAFAAPEPAQAKVRIVAKVGDLVITNVQVDARSKLLMQQSPELRKKMSSSAQSFFKTQVQKRWKKIAQSKRFQERLRAYVMGKRPTSREEQQKYVKQFVQKRQKRLQGSLQKEARAHGLKAVQGGLKTKALDNLIDESLKLYEAKRLSVLASVDDAKKAMGEIAQRNNKTRKEFEAGLRASGIPPTTLRDKIRADRSWQNVIRKKYGFQLAMMQSTLDRFIGQQAGGGGGGLGGAAAPVTLDVKRIRIASTAPGAGLVQALQQADGIRQRINSCGALAGVTTGVPGARYEDLGKRDANAISNPVVRELLLKARVGEPIPPQIDGQSVDLWVLCGRQRAQAGAQPRRQPAQADDRQKEFQILARRHLNDLRREVRIERR